MYSLNDLKKDKEVAALIEAAESQLGQLGFTEHGVRHLEIVVQRTAYILQQLNYDSYVVEQGKIAAYLHDIGNAVNRYDHAQTGALLAYNILRHRNVDPMFTAQIMMAIGNHDENYGQAISPVSAALILADKSDVHRSRVRAAAVEQLKNPLQDIHDRVNHAVIDSSMILDCDSMDIVFKFIIDAKVCTAMDYFEIFLRRMKMCQNAATHLGLNFKLNINDNYLA